MATTQNNDREPKIFDYLTVATSSCRRRSRRDSVQTASDDDHGPSTSQILETSVPEASKHGSDFLARLIRVSRREAWEIVGGLSRPSKMPCYAWGLPAQACRMGGKLVDIAGSVCASCYALKGRYRMPQVQNANARRLERAAHPEWVPAMVKLVYWQAVETGVPFFRWFDTGDLQSVEMLRSIAAVAVQTPEIRHWLPTRELRIVEKYRSSSTLPANLVIRISARLVDELPPEFDLPTSTVHYFPELAQGFTCRAANSTPPACGSCRTCWSTKVANVSYPLH